MREASSLSAVIAAADEVGWPVVLKTAAPGIEHRSDVGGVVVGIADEYAAAAAYTDLAARLGPDVTVHQQVPAGVEISVGLVRDPRSARWSWSPPGGCWSSCWPTAWSACRR